MAMAKFPLVYLPPRIGHTVATDPVVNVIEQSGMSYHPTNVLKRTRLIEMYSFAAHVNV